MATLLRRSGCSQLPFLISSAPTVLGPASSVKHWGNSIGKTCPRYLQDLPCASWLLKVLNPPNQGLLLPVLACVFGCGLPNR